MSYVWPDRFPTKGGTEFWIVRSSTDTAPIKEVRVGGVLAKVLEARLGQSAVARCVAPPHAAGPVDVTITQMGTLQMVSAATYVSTGARTRLHARRKSLPGVDNAGLPGSIKALGTASAGVAFTFSDRGRWAALGVGGSETSFTSPILGPNGTGTRLDRVLLAAFGMPLHGVRSIGSGTWTYRGSDELLCGLNGKGEGNSDRLAVYVYRPSSGSVIGRVYDATVPNTHPAGFHTDRVFPESYVERPASQYRVANTTSWIERSFYWNAGGKIEVDYFTEGEKDHDGFQLSVDGEVKFTRYLYPGTKATRIEASIPAGAHVIRFSHLKDGAGDAGLDTSRVYRMRRYDYGSTLQETIYFAGTASGATPAGWTSGGGPNNTKWTFTPDGNYPAGTVIDEELVAVVLDFTGSAVSGIQDGDLLVWEVHGTYRNLAASYDMQARWRFDGANVPATNGEVLSPTGSIAVALDAPADIFAASVYVPPPDITSVSPAYGSTLGQSVTILGRGFTGVTSVKFDGVEVTSKAILGDTSISCLVPPHATGVVDVVVTRASDSFTLEAGFEYRDLQLAVTPNRGPIAGGTLVVVSRQ